MLDESTNPNTVLNCHSFLDREFFLPRIGYWLINYVLIPLIYPKTEYSHCYINHHSSKITSMYSETKGIILSIIFKYYVPERESILFALTVFLDE